MFFCTVLRQMPLSRVEPFRHVFAVAPMAQDFNGDGLTDLAVLETSQRRVAVFNGRAGGSSARRCAIPPVRGCRPALRRPISPATGALKSPWWCRVLRSVDSPGANNGSGTFISAGHFHMHTPVSVVRACRTTMPLPTLSLHASQPNMVALLYANGDGTFVVRPIWRVGPPRHVALSDMNRDSQTDIVLLRAMNYPSCRSCPYLQTSSRAFTAAGLSPACPTTRA
jgi:hypothetical protein